MLTSYLIYGLQKAFSHSTGCLFLLLFLLLCRNFKFDVVPLVDFLLLLHIQKNHCQIILSLFSDDMILYIENFKDSIKRLL